MLLQSIIDMGHTFIAIAKIFFLWDVILMSLSIGIVVGLLIVFLDWREEKKTKKQDLFNKHITSA